MTHKTDKQRAEFLAALPAPPNGIRLTALEYYPGPAGHFYCITPRHVEYAADYCSGMLGEAAIAGAERTGAKCGVKGCTLPYSAHTQDLVLLVSLPLDSAPKDLNAVPGLHAYLLEIKERCDAFGIAGFGFPHHGAPVSEEENHDGTEQ